MTAQGKPVLGAFAGLFLGLFLWLELMVLGVISLDSVMFWVLPIVGLILGIALGMAGPLKRNR